MRTRFDIFPPASTGVILMTAATRPATDLVEEFVLRRWAREHYAPVDQRDGEWHPVVLDEMRQKDIELSETAEFALTGRRIVPLVPEPDRRLPAPHFEPHRAMVLLRVPTVSTEQRAGDAM